MTRRLGTTVTTVLVALLVPASYAAQLDDVKRFPGISKWWYEAIPTPQVKREKPDVPTVLEVQVEWLNRNKYSGICHLATLPENLRPAADYICRLMKFRRGGPPSGTPLSEIHRYHGLWMSGGDLTYAIVRKSKKSPDFLAPDILRRLADGRSDGTVGVVALRALAAMDALDDTTKPMFAAWLNDKTGDPQFDSELAEHRRKQAEEDKKRLDYGITWGPVGPDAAKIAIADLAKEERRDTGDTKWLTCIEVIRKAKSADAVGVLLEYADYRDVEEPSDKPWDPDPLNKYPAITALLELGPAVPPKVAEEVAKLRHVVNGHMAFSEQTAVNVLAAIMTPMKCLEWLDTLDKDWAAKIPEKERGDGDSILPQIRRLKDLLLNTKNIPKYSDKQAFWGSVVLPKP